MTAGDPSDRLQAIVAIQAALSALGDDEVCVLGEVARRLVAGQRTYGRLSLRTDRRDWPTEALDEIADALAYLAAALVCIERRCG